MVIPEGRQLDDVKAVGSGAVTKGIFTLISDATCVELNGEKNCVPAADLMAAAKEGPLSSLNVPEWASKGAGVMGNSHRRLEGLIAPGTWNVDPSGTPKEILATLIAESNDHYVKGGLLETAQALNLSPYEVLIVGSLVQKESKPADFAKGECQIALDLLAGRDGMRAAAFDAAAVRAEMARVPGLEGLATAHDPVESAETVESDMPLVEL
jgi:UPF0755 protein